MELLLTITLIEKLKLMAELKGKYTTTGGFG